MAEEEGGGKIAVVEDPDMGDGAQCTQHPFKKSPGGICGFCLQEKLGKLVSASFPTIPILGRSSSSSPSPSFRSDIASVYGGFKQSAASSSAGNTDQCHARRSRMPFLLSKKKTNASDFAAFRRSNSTTTTAAPKRGPFLDAEQVFDKSPRRKRTGLWPFLYLSSSSSSSSSKPGSSRDADKGPRDSKITSLAKPSSRTAEEDSNGLSRQEQERKVSRSRSVGCGSRSFSGDFFGRISTGFGDCTLRRAESHREAKPGKSSSSASQESQNNHQYIRGKVRCGGIFGGFMLTSSSSSSSSSSRWVSDDIAAGNKQAVNGRSRSQRNSWGWALASPMRAFSRHSSKDAKRSEASNKNSSVANLDAIPSLLAVRQS